MDMRMRIAVVGLALIAASAGCRQSDPDEAGAASAASTTQTTGRSESDSGATLAPPPSAVTTPAPDATTDIEVSALTTPDYSSAMFATLEVGESRPTQVWAACAISIEVGDDRYLADREIAKYPGRDWRASDFPPEWDVIAFNEAPQDGPSWAILDAKVMRIDAATLEVRHVGTDELIANFILDETPPDERIVC
jgi:hypothetical protein